jgi:hypothetical protein
MSDDMNLPEGRTCKDCVSFQGCMKLFGCSGDNTTCDWSPSNFKEGWEYRNKERKGLVGKLTCLAEDISDMTSLNPERAASASRAWIMLQDDEKEIRKLLAKIEKLNKDRTNHLTALENIRMKLREAREIAELKNPS